jgi:hypothetical protein
VGKSALGLGDHLQAGGPMTASQERARIRRLQRGPLRNLRDQLDTTECLSEASDLDRLSGCGRGNLMRIKHACDCPFGCLLADIRALDAATRPGR